MEAISDALEEYVDSGEVDERLAGSLGAKLDAAEASLERGNLEAAVGQLEAFIQQVEAQRGKKIDAAAADDLIAQAQAIIDRLEGKAAGPAKRMLAAKVPGLAALSPEQAALAAAVPTTRTIDYTYDDLYRLTAADYDSGEFFHYSYDRVGNRLTQDTLAGTNAYTYDAANRLVEVDGVAYTWDAKGNLLSDGSLTYSYDHANRLIGVTQGGDTFAFAYNGLGDRLRQSVDGSSEQYTLDLNRGLTQVLADGENTYLYGRSAGSGPALRLGEEGPDGWQHHLGDALGSVRSLADGSAEVTSARAYEPFGATMISTGPAVSSYSFTGEWEDQTRLIHLRARYYMPGSGRFLSLDLWPGLTRQPSTQNSYTYVTNNPVNVTDPSGNWCFLGNDVPPLSIDPCTPEEIELWHGVTAAIGQTIGGLKARSSVTGLDPFSEFLAEVFVIFFAQMWETELVQGPVAHRDTLFGQDSSFWERLDSAIDVWCSTGQPVTEYFLLPWAVARTLDVSPRQFATGQLSLSQSQAVRYLRTNGFTEARARSFILSFSDDPITVRSVRPGETFLRYTNDPTSQGSFLTTRMFNAADDAVGALNLPRSNTADYVQTVTAIRETVVLEGGIAGGWQGVKQVVIVESGSFEFTLGVRFR